ncbi:TRAP transporter large permease subunit [Blastococcus sp. CT_GayMR20]|uniref:TRAP transporter large permease n=1 Tax=Blastococcus sp. CT_GayMR20 TaxID=2559609 RepID=UPI00107468FF|nr:TRAP transporter large permease subunit [Blastococcus sp. CT_GayMR20]TFV81115.1 TRAP transporter large permease subunit [Blastococcus sp. CT_GayMR20]
MDAEVVIGLGVLSLLILLAIGLPVAFALGICGGLGVLLVTSFDVATDVYGRETFESVVGYTLVVIPLFVLMGMAAKRSKMGEEVFWIISRRLRRVPGGLGIATVGAGAVFAAMTGSSAAAVATLGPIAITEMRKHGYSDRLAAGVVSAAGTLGILIPPSVVIVLYGVLSGMSIERLLIAGLVPGILTAVLYATAAWFLGRTHVSLPLDVGGGEEKTTSEGDGPVGTGAGRPDGAAGPITMVESEVAPPGVTPGPWRALVEVFLLFVLVVGGLYAGVFTAVESAAVGALASLAILAGRARSRRFSAVKTSWEALTDTVSISGMIYALLIGASIFTLFMTMAGAPQSLADWITGLAVPPLLVVALVLLAIIPLGMFLDGFSILLIMVPLLHPVIVDNLGFDGIWFAILFVKCIELGLITPPVGINVFVAAGSVPGLSPEVAFRGVMPFFLVDLMGVVVMFLVPGLITFLPGLMA